MLTLASSCVSTGGGYGSGGYGDGYGGGYGGGHDHPPHHDPGPPYYDEGRPNRIPRGADLVYEGQDRLRWDVDQDGTVYVYSIGENRIPWTGPVRRGQQIVVTPKEDSIYVDGRVVYRGNLERNSPHQIYITRPGGWGGGGRPGGGWGGGGYPGGGGRPDTDRPSSIPREARFMHETKGNLYWNAPEDGTVWVYSVDDNRIPFTGRMRRGQEVLVNPGDDRITLAGQRVYQGNLVREGQHQIWFDRAGGWGGGSGGGGGGGGYPGGGGSGGDLPRGAREVASGRGDIALHEAPRDGTVYVYDNESRRVLYSTNVGRGNSFQIYPGQNAVNLNSERHAEVRLPRGRSYSLYFRER
jgi:hypothetical protein